MENLAREALQPGELAAALLYERSAVLTAKLLADEVPIPADVAALEDPVSRFRALDRLRVEAGRHHIGAPWSEVLRRLGIQMREDTARQLVRAFAALPAEISSEMDAAKVALATRLDYLRLDRGSADRRRRAVGRGHGTASGPSCCRPRCGSAWPIPTSTPTTPLTEPRRCGSRPTRPGPGPSGRRRRTLQLKRRWIRRWCGMSSRRCASWRVSSAPAPASGASTPARCVSTPASWSS